MLRPLLPPKGCAANYYKYVVMLPEGTDRTKLKAWLKDEHGVQCSGEVYEFPLHKHPVLIQLNPGNLKGAEIACGRQMCLPIFAYFVLRSPRWALFSAIFIATGELEIVGTTLGNWAWVPVAPWTHIPSGNPPSVIAGGY